MTDKVQMTLGEFRAKVAHLPDETALIVEMEDCWDFREVAESMKFFPAMFGLPPALILTTPDTEFRLDEEHMLGERLDDWLETVREGDF